MFLHNWAESGIEGLIEDFELDGSELDGVEILFASYSIDSWEGTAFVLFRKDGKYYEVNAGHCSCYGLEGQWEPEEADLKELWHRVTEGTFGRYEFADELKGVLADLLGR